MYKKITMKDAKKAMKKNPLCRVSDKKRKKKAKSFKKKWGFRFEDCWNLDHSIAYFILPRLIHLRDIECEYIGFLSTNKNDTSMKKIEVEEQWEKILDQIIYGFYLYINKDIANWNEDDYSDWKTAKALFIEHYEKLWN